MSAKNCDLKRVAELERFCLAYAEERGVGLREAPLNPLGDAHCPACAARARRPAGF